MTARTISAGNMRLSGTPRTTEVVQASEVSQLERHGTPPPREPDTPRRFTSPFRGQQTTKRAFAEVKRRVEDHFGGCTRVNHQACTPVHAITPATTPQPNAILPVHAELTP